jgi:hypothetical protein
MFSHVASTLLVFYINYLGTESISTEQCKKETQEKTISCNGNQEEIV